LLRQQPRKHNLLAGQRAEQGAPGSVGLESHFNSVGLQEILPKDKLDLAQKRGQDVSGDLDGGGGSAHTTQLQLECHTTHDGNDAPGSGGHRLQDWTPTFQPQLVCQDLTDETGACAGVKQASNVVRTLCALDAPLKHEFKLLVFKARICKSLTGS
jgi:hypothetical protein